MKKHFVFALLTLVVSFSNTFADDAPVKPYVAPKNVVQHLQDISVTILSKGRTGSGEGSGVIKSIKANKDETISFVWTAAHVVSNLRQTRTVIDSKTGTTKVVVEFDDAIVVKTIVQDGRKVSRVEFDAEVVRFSAEEDLALLRIRMKNVGFIRETSTFYLEKKDGKPVIPDLNTDLLHVGSLLGQMGSNSLTRGIMSQHGRLVDKKVFDQTTVTAFPGSSGGGVYLTDGRLVGLVLRGAGETFNLMVPVRRMEQWATQAGVLWAMDDQVPMPKEEDLKKLPVEDNGTSFTYSIKSEAAKPHKATKLSLIGSGPFQLGSEEAEMLYPTYLEWKPKTPVIKE